MSRWDLRYATLSLDIYLEARTSYPDNHPHMLQPGAASIINYTVQRNQQHTKVRAIRIQ